MNLIRAELLKIRTTNAWWLYGLGAFVMTALALVYNSLALHFAMKENGGAVEGMSHDETLRTLSGNLYTSGQFFGLLFVMIIGILAITNEFQHQTATTTFLTTPRRTAVVIAKLVATMVFGVILWLMSTIMSVITGVIFLNSENLPNQLDDSSITNSILLNLMAYAIWGILGVGVGVLIRSQIGATVTAAIAYLIGTFLAIGIFALLANVFDNDSIEKWAIVVPSIASNLMITGAGVEGDPSRWAGAAVLIGYAVVTGVAGTLIVRRRDIS